MPLKIRRTFAALAAVASAAVLGAVTYADADSPRATDAEAAATLRAKLRAQEIESEVHEEAFRRAGGTVATLPAHVVEVYSTATCPIPPTPNEVRPGSLADLPEPGPGVPRDLPSEVLQVARGTTPAGHAWHIITGWRGAPRRATALFVVFPISMCGGVDDDYGFGEGLMDFQSEAALEVEGIDGATVTMRTIESAGNCTIRIDIDLGTVDDPCRLVISGLPSDGSLRRY